MIGAGVGRTGAYSLKLAINRPSLGPCHHMEEGLHNRPTQHPLWEAALDGRPGRAVPAHHQRSEFWELVKGGQ